MDDDNSEPITLSHDIDSILDFDNCEIASNFLSSSLFLDEFEIKTEVEEVQEHEDPLYIDKENGTKQNIKNTKLSIKNIRKKNAKSISKKKKKLSPRKEDVFNSSIHPELRERLARLSIKLIHAVPDQHTIETVSGTHAPTKLQKQAIERLGPIKNGKFSTDEDKIIQKNWKMFCELHHWNPKDVEPFLQMRHNNTYLISTLNERQKFVQFLGNGLPWRTLYSIYYRFRNLYGAPKWQRYSQEEDKKILTHIKKALRTSEDLNQSFATLEKKLNRSKLSIQQRYETLQKERKSKKLSSCIEPTSPMISKFIKTLMKLTLSEDVFELKDADIPLVVWKKMESSLLIRHRILQHFWYQHLHMQLFCPKPMSLNSVKIKLIEYIYGMGVLSTKDITWTEVANCFEGITPRFLSITFQHLLEIPKKKSNSTFAEAMEYLYTQKISQLRLQSTDKILPRLSYDKGDVKLIDQVDPYSPK